MNTHHRAYKVGQLLKIKHPYGIEDGLFYIIELKPEISTLVYCHLRYEHLKYSHTYSFVDRRFEIVGDVLAD